MLFALSVVSCLTVIVTCIETLIGMQRIKKLEQASPITNNEPKVSIIIAARNEGPFIGRTLDKLLTQTYKNIEIICVNDRSNDDTANIIQQYAATHQHIDSLHIKQLPEGWFGKSHALQQGSQLASGEWLLFMDADVSLNEETVSRAVTYATNQMLDHLSVLPHYICKGFLYNIVNLVQNGHGILLPLKPWLAKSKHSKKSFNIGFFCLIKQSVYQEWGGHQAIRFECLDDLKLGEQIKAAGYAQEIVNAQHDVTVMWYENLSAMFQGLKKNAFSFFQYNIWIAFASIIAWIVFFTWPIAGAILTSHLTQTVNIISLLVLLGFYIRVAYFFDVPIKYALFYPIGLLIYPYVMIASIAHYFRNKGIYWRGTFYDAVALKQK